MGVYGQTWRTAEPRNEAGQLCSSGGPARALLLIEIADFVQLRRAVGIARADLLALQVAERAAAVLPDAAVVTAGRNLIELALSVADRDELDRAVAHLHLDAAQPLVVAGKTVPLRLSIGAALSFHDEEVKLVEAAEAALEGARAGGGARTTMAAAALEADEQIIGEELRTAIAKDEFFLQYQPKLHLRRQEITSIEALIRWRHPRRGLVMPGDFIPAAERCGAIKAMTLWTLRQAIADQRVLATDGHSLPIFINIAGALLSDSDFVTTACALVRESGASLGFEITETSVIREPERAIEHLRQLAEIGVAITIDDYGAGLSSLAYLKQLPARELKIDKLFVTKLSSSHRDPLIVRSTIDLAHALEMEVVAEGVETPAALALLSVMGCDMVQGFLISRPLVLEALLSYLQQGSHSEFLDKARAPLRRLTAIRTRA